jgi:hypothetical protein
MRRYQVANAVIGRTERPDACQVALAVILARGVVSPAR